MALFLAIVSLPVAFLTLDGVVSNGWKRVFPVLLLLPIRLLLLLAIRLDGLIGTGRSGGLGIGLLCFFGPRFLGVGFLGSGSLGLHF